MLIKSRCIQHAFTLISGATICRVGLVLVIDVTIRNSRIKLSQGQLFWREVGQGTTLIFLHDAWADGSQWLPVVEQLTQSYHCVTPDLIGFGESERPPLHYSIALQVECLQELCDALKLQRLYFVATGIGGWVAASYALRDPERVKGLVLLAPEGVDVGQPERWRWAKWLTSRVPIALWLLQAMRPIAHLWDGRAQVDTLLILRQQWRRSPAACQLLFKRRAAEIRAELLSDRLHLLNLPLLVLQGEWDDSIAADLNRIYGDAPNAKTHFIPAGPDPLETAPDKVALEIREFIQ